MKIEPVLVLISGEARHTGNQIDAPPLAFATKTNGLSFTSCSGVILAAAPMNGGKSSGGALLLPASALTPWIQPGAPWLTSNTLTSPPQLTPDCAICAVGSVASLGGGAAFCTPIATVRVASASHAAAQLLQGLNRDIGYAASTSSPRWEFSWSVGGPPSTPAEQGAFVLCWAQPLDPATNSSSSSSDSSSSASAPGAAAADKSAAAKSGSCASSYPSHPSSHSDAAAVALSDPRCLASLRALYGKLRLAPRGTCSPQGAGAHLRGSFSSSPRGPFKDQANGVVQVAADASSVSTCGGRTGRLGALGRHGPPMQSGQPGPGHLISVVGSPFGCLAPFHFVNAQVNGVVACAFPAPTESLSLAVAAGLPYPYDSLPRRQQQQQQPRQQRQQQMYDNAGGISNAGAHAGAVLFALDAHVFPGMEGAPVTSTSSRQPQAEAASSSPPTQLPPPLLQSPPLALLCTPLQRRPDGVQVPLAVAWQAIAAALLGVLRELLRRCREGGMAAGEAGGCGLGVDEDEEEEGGGGAAEACEGSDASIGHQQLRLQHVVSPGASAAAWAASGSRGGGGAEEDGRGCMQQQYGSGWEGGGNGSSSVGSVNCGGGCGPAASTTKQGGVVSQAGRYCFFCRPPPTTTTTPMMLSTAAAACPVPAASTLLPWHTHSAPCPVPLALPFPHPPVVQPADSGSSLSIPVSEAQQLPGWVLHAVVLLRCNGSWATGVVVEAGSGLLITTAHLFNGLLREGGASRGSGGSSGARGAAAGDGGPSTAAWGHILCWARVPWVTPDAAGRVQPGAAAAAGTGGGGGAAYAAGGGGNEGVAAGYGYRWLRARVLYVWSNHLDLAVLQLEPPYGNHRYGSGGWECPAAVQPTPLALAAIQVAARARSDDDVLHDSPLAACRTASSCAADHGCRTSACNGSYYNTATSSSGNMSSSNNRSSRSVTGCNDGMGSLPSSVSPPQSGEADGTAQSALYGRGTAVWAVGHSLIGPSAEWPPLVSYGCVARVLRRRSGVPTMLLATTTTHAGGSGGALLDSRGRLVGLVTSNARHAGGATLPNMAFCIAAEELEPVLRWAAARAAGSSSSSSWSSAAESCECCAGAAGAAATHGSAAAGAADHAPPGLAALAALDEYDEDAERIWRLQMPSLEPPPPPPPPSPPPPTPPTAAAAGSPNHALTAPGTAATPAATGSEVGGFGAMSVAARYAVDVAAATSAAAASGAASAAATVKGRPKSRL
ncbi:hypothetical protein Agub_g9800 [Astrephomene gubernaculifera]|uniref:Glyoxysomal processing protease, glyoxysomal n=1 Tax=Astrephomene gubernaculifera TaxID=47775 RepID=A0AAD3HPB4_9CHLO|nr:hypothetical protein Agub_g9800 [Astrephomene gubernaculifera]